MSAVETHHVLLDSQSALRLTAEIKSWAGTLWLKLKEAHDGQAHRALGYSSWAEYVRVEFDMGKSQAYRLIAHADAVSELAAAAGLAEVSPIGDTSENQTRKADIPALAEAVREAADALPDTATDEDRAALVAEHLAQSQPVAPAPPADDADPDAPSSASGSAPITITKTTTEKTVIDGDTGEILEQSDVDRHPAKPVDMDDLVDPALVLRRDASKAVEKQAALLALDPRQVAAALNPDDRSTYLRLAGEMQQWARHLVDALTNTQLRRVK